MKRYKIFNINDYMYTLRDDTGRKFRISITFYDAEAPQEGEHLFLSEKLFDKKANEGVWHFHFGGLSECYGKNIPEEDIEHARKFVDSYSSSPFFTEVKAINAVNDEILVIKRDNERVILKRFYG